MADAGTRLRVGIVGTSTFSRIRVDLDAEETAVRAAIVTTAAKKFGVPSPAIDCVLLYYLSRAPKVQRLELYSHRARASRRPRGARPTRECHEYRV